MKKTTLAMSLALGVSMVGALSAMPAMSHDGDGGIFQLTERSASTLIANCSKCDGEKSDKSGQTKASKDGDSKCGSGACGSKDGDSHCGSKDGESHCGSKDGDSKCGAGACGSN